MSARLVQPSIQDVIDASACHYYSRRSGARHNRGRGTNGGGGLVNVGTPLTSVGGAPVVLMWLRSDLGTVTGASWTDNSGNAVDAAQATGASQPTVAVDPVLGVPVVTGDGVAHHMTFTLDRPVPGPGTETTVIAVIKQNAWVGGAALYGFGNAIVSAVQGTGSPGISMRNTTSVNNSMGAPLNSWARMRQSFTGSTSDVNKVGAAAAVTGASAGVTDPGATGTLFARTSAASFCSVSYYEFIILAGVPTPTQLGQYDNYLNRQLGIGKVIV